MVEINKIYNEDCLLGMKKIDDGAVDVILTDPPYLYLKGQKLDRPFDETAFFNECKRVLKKDGFIVMFGRGTSFYRWNTMLANLGFVFKEEIVWNNHRPSIPALKLHRIHETISVHTIEGKINKSFVPYMEYKSFKIESIIADIKRIKSALNSKELHDVLEYVRDKVINYVPKKNTAFFKNSIGNRSRAAATCKQMIEGVNEKSVFEIAGDHFSTIHPTQKPVRLLERLLYLVVPKGVEHPLVLDPFSGSASTAIAARNSGCDFIGFEIDKEYFDGGNKRLQSINN
jgi:site-specific DNA-methyltransferase (adenine-specific)